MAAGGDWTLTNSDIARLAAAISSTNMDTIAVRYLDMDPDTLESMRDEHRGKAEAFNREVIKRWAYKHSSSHQVQVFASILYRAAREGSYVNPEKVQEILRVECSQITEQDLHSSGTAQPLSDDEAEISEEMLELVEDLKEDTEEAMRIEMAPWVQNYTVKMEDLYTERTLDQMENKPTGPQPVKLDNYMDLFPKKKATQKHHKSDLEKRSRTLKRRKSKGKKGKKILAKGDPGMGKSTLGRKIAYDWAKGVFTAVSVVFFVSMKLIRPGQTIQNIIIRQNSRLEALNVAEQNMRILLNAFADSCLIIFDGLDEHDYGANEDIVNIIEGRRLLYCNILVTSRPHCTEKIEVHFPTQVRVEGFTKDHANQFISKSVNQNAKIQAIVALNSDSFISQRSPYSCPMILLFLCILVNSDELDLHRRVVPIGEVYARLIRCVYRKYCVQNNLPFDNTTFEEMLKNVGKVAWSLLPYNQGCGKLSDIIKDIGDDAFNIGLLIGHKDFRLSGHETADVVVTFVHSIIQDFLGAFYFILSLNEGIAMETLLGCGRKQQPFLKNRLFFQFCLWLLSDSCWNQYFRFAEKQKIYESLVSYATVQLDVLQLDVVELSWVFPILYIPHSHGNQRTDSLKFLQKVLSGCHRTRELYLSSISKYPADFTRCISESFLPNVTMFGDRMVHKVKPAEHESSDESLTLYESAANNAEILTLLKRYEETGCHPQLNLLTQDLPTDLSTFMHSSVGRLSLFSVYAGASSIKEDLEIQSCAFLTELCLVKLDVHESVLDALTKAVQKGNLPVLSHLSFAGAGTSIKGKLSKLLEHRWPALNHLNLDDCFLDPADISVLTHRTICANHKTLPNVTSLVLNVADVRDRKFGTSLAAVNVPSLLTFLFPSVFPKGLHQKVQRPIYATLVNMFQTALINIKTLDLKQVCKEEYQSLAVCINEGKLPNLTQLSISMWKYVGVHQYVQAPVRTQIKNFLPILYFLPEKNIEKLTPVKFPTLNILSLKHFVCCTRHLLTVAMTTEFSRLSQLDISHSSGISGKLHYLVGYSFPFLTDLILSDCGLNSLDLINLAKASVKGRLPELRHLDVSVNPETVGHLENLFEIRQNWKGLLQLNNTQDVSLDVDLQAVSDAVQAGALTNLQELSVSAHSRDRLPIVHWPNVLHLRINCIVGNRSSDFMKIFQQIVEAVEKERLPKLQTLKLRSDKEKTLGGHLRLDEVFQTFMENQPQDALLAVLEQCASMLAYVYLPVLSKYMAPKNRESHQRYMKEVVTFSSVMKESWSQVLPRLESRAVQVTDEAQNFGASKSTVLSSQSSDVQIAKDTLRDVSVFLHDCVDSFPNLSEACRSLLNRLLDAVFRALQTVIEGKRLDLQPLCDLLQDAVKFIPNKSHHPLLKSLLDVTLRNFQRFWNEGQYDLQPIIDILNDWVENASHLSETYRKYLRSVLDLSIEIVRALDDGEPLDLNPLCRVHHDFLDSSPKLSKADVCFLKNSSNLLFTRLQNLINEEFNPETFSIVMFQMLDMSPWMPDPYRSLIRDMVHLIQSALDDADSKPDNASLLAAVKYRLRKRGILVYTE